MDIRQGKELACSEIRAARAAECFNKEPGLCKLSNEWIQSLCHSYTKRCVRKTAKEATAAMFPDEADVLVDEVFDRCFDDRIPHFKKVDE